MSVLDYLTNVHLLTLLVSSVFPLLVGLVTKASWGGGVKAVLLALLAAVAGFVSEYLVSVTDDTPYNVEVGLFVAVTGFLTAVGVHFGLLKPTGAAYSVASKMVKD